MVKLLISCGAMINAIDKACETSLHWAVRRGHKEVVEILIRAGANINTKNNYGWTPLHCAAYNARKDIAELLIKAAPYMINAKDNFSNTPLHRSVFWGNEDIVELLLEVGADITINNDDNQTAAEITKKQAIKETIKSYMSIARR